MKSWILAGAIVGLACCNKKNHEHAGTAANSEHAERVKDAGRRKPETTSVFDYQAAKAALREKKSPARELMSQYARKIAAAENLDFAEALNKMFLEATDDLTKHDYAYGHVLVASVSAIIQDSSNPASAVAALPAGELRTGCVMRVLDPSVSIDAAKEIYDALPESADKGKAGKLLVQKTYFTAGIGKALDVIDSMESAPERRNALMDLGSKIRAAALADKGSTSPGDMDKFLNFADQKGMGDVGNIFRNLK